MDYLIIVLVLTVIAPSALYAVARVALFLSDFLISALGHSVSGLLFGLAALLDRLPRKPR
jgi:hypothetical protein